MFHFDWILTTRPRRALLAPASHFRMNYQPSAEPLEERDCPSVAAPTGLQLTAVGPTQVNLSWNDVAGEQGFRIEQWNGTQQVQVGTVGPNVTTFSATGLTPNTVQYFAVQAFDSTTSAQSAWASITTPANPITAPSNVQATAITTTQATLTWTAATGQTGYSIYGWNGTSAVQIGSVGATATSFKVTNLTPGTTNYFYVQSFNTTGYASSPWVTVSTLSQQLTAPGNLHASALDSASIQLSWTDSAGETGYRIYAWNGVSGSTPVVVATLAANTTGYQATGLQPGQSVWFYVQAFNTTATANTPWVKATTVSAPPLKAPTNVTATETALGTVTITWTEPARAAGYNVYVWSGYHWILTQVVAAGTHQASISGLASNQTVWFLVQAFTANYGEYANSAFAFVNL